MSPAGPHTPPRQRPRGLPALAVGHGLSALADGVYFVALPWLALEITGSAAALGGVLALAALPRTAFMVLGGAWADRFPPKWLLVASSATSAALVGALAAASGGWLGAPAPWVLYAAAAALGVVDAVAYPASGALVPRLVPPERLHRANALLGVLTQASTFAGPAAAAALLAWRGTGATLAASAALSVGAVLALLLLPRAAPARDAADPQPAGTVAALAAALRFLRQRPLMVAVIAMFAGLNLGLLGPIVVGGAALAEARYGGPEAFGALVSAWGAGGLAGALGASAWAPRRAVGLMAAASVAMAAGVALWALPMPLAALLALAAALGLLSGWSEVHSTTWVQQRTPEPLQGRVQGLLLVALVGVEPLSYALAGALAEASLPWTFGLGGAVAALAALPAVALARLEASGAPGASGG